MRSIAVFSDLTLPSGPARYEAVCELHRLVTASLMMDLRAINDGSIKDPKDKANVLSTAIRFLKDNKIKANKSTSPMDLESLLGDLNLPEFIDEQAINYTTRDK